MTLVTTASALIDDLVRSGSFLRNQVSACDYGIIDTSQAGCIVVLQPSQTSFQLIGYGGATLDNWGITAECYIKVTGDMIATMTKVWAIHDAVKGAITGGCLAGSGFPHLVAEVVGANKPRNQFFGLGGHDVIPVFVDIVVREDP